MVITWSSWTVKIRVLSWIKKDLLPPHDLIQKTSTIGLRPTVIFILIGLALHFGLRRNEIFTLGDLGLILIQTLARVS